MNDFAPMKAERGKMLLEVKVKTEVDYEASVFEPASKVLLCGSHFGPNALQNPMKKRVKPQPRRRARGSWINEVRKRGVGARILRSDDEMMEHQASVTPTVKEPVPIPDSPSTKNW